MVLLNPYTKQSVMAMSILICVIASLNSTSIKEIILQEFLNRFRLSKKGNIHPLIVLSYVLSIAVSNSQLVYIELLIDNPDIPGMQTTTFLTHMIFFNGN